MIAIIDYGAGNLFSVANALSYLGEDYCITNQSEEICKAGGLILPGVGAFPYAMKQLDQTGLIQTIREQVQEKPLLGICLGMQMLFQKSYEFEETDGLGLIPGTIEKIPDTGLKIPHMGWNQLRVQDAENPLLQGISQGDCVYFVHSFMACTSKENIAADCEYGVGIPALVSSKNVYGAQFHPEKSGETGLQILRNFASLTK